jgi:hypothetical protein
LLSTPLGKLLRINSDGSIPSDNPFYSQTGADPSIWALGLRNPYTFAVDSATARIHVNDVGQNLWEEVNLGGRGANYGWPQTEGPDPAGVSGVRYPIYAYPHDGSACAVTGATFYRPQIFRFPPEYAGRYFFGDFCAGFIRMLNPPNYSSPAEFATGISFLVDIQTHQDVRCTTSRVAAEAVRVQSTTSTIVFNDDFESELGWTLTAGANNAIRGLWERGDPQPTINAGMPFQLDTCQGSMNCLITGLVAGTSNGVNDVDNGQTSIQSPPIALPAGRPLTLTFGLYFAHNLYATSADLFRVRVGPLTLGALPEGRWRPLTADERAALIRDGANRPA